jgi:hypothetical protein
MRQPKPRVVKVESKQTPIMRPVQVILPRPRPQAVAAVAHPLTVCMAQCRARVAQQDQGHLMHDLREQGLAVTGAESAAPEEVQVQKTRKLVREENTCPFL